MDTKNKDPSTKREGILIYDAVQIANWFIKRAKRDGRNLSLMSILKLCYIAHGKHLTRHRAPLFPNLIQAWQYGPVINDVYAPFRGQGIYVGQPLDRIPDVEKDSSADKLLEDVWEAYGHYPPFKLSALTHMRGGPWDVARARFGWYAPISNEVIKQHYDAMESKSG